MKHRPALGLLAAAALLIGATPALPSTVTLSASAPTLLMTRQILNGRDVRTLHTHLVGPAWRFERIVREPSGRIVERRRGFTLGSPTPKWVVKGAGPAGRDLVVHRVQP